jgi:1,4-alpha-glucan branching enzyme
MTVEFSEGPVSASSRYRDLGAHLVKKNGKDGTNFSVWAPNAVEVSVLLNQNSWTAGATPLQSSDRGVWSGFVPGVKQGDIYKFALKTPSGQIIEKSDPVAFHCETRPKTGSIVWDLGGYSWEDQDWLKYRQETDWYNAPVTVYEVHLGSWKRPTDGRRYFSYTELAPQLIEYCQQMGYTHLQLMPITEYPFDGSWGYQVTGFYAPTSRYGTPQDFMKFVDLCHQAGIGVLIDWVPAHFPRDGHSLGHFDGTACYEHADPKQGAHPDWGTLVFNYDRFEVREFLWSSARLWADVYHVDGLRFDAVASMLYLDYSREEGEWVPNKYGGRENLGAIDFLKELNTQLHADFPGIMTIAEESTSWGGVSRPVYTGGLGFSMKWDMGWMNDTLSYLRNDPVHRSFHQNELSFRMMYAFTENFLLPLSHDEVVHGKKSLLSQMPGDYWQQFANLRLLFGYQYTSPGKKLLFMGGELGQWTEWNHDEELDWALEGHMFHDGLKRFVGDLNRVYRTEPALYDGECEPGCFQWIQADDWQNSVFSWIRSNRDSSESVVVICNFTPVPRGNYRIGVPQEGFYQEVLNSDSEHYGGSNVGNIGGVVSESVAMHGLPQSVSLFLPPLGILVLKHTEMPPAIEEDVDQEDTGEFDASGRKVSGGKTVGTEDVESSDVSFPPTA